MTIPQTSFNSICQAKKEVKVTKVKEIKDDKNSVVWLAFEDKRNSYYGIDSTARENGVKYYKLDVSLNTCYVN